MATVNITLPYTPRDWQRRFHLERKRFSVAVCHRRAGKSFAAMMELIESALVKPRQHLAYIAPYLNQARKVMWGPLKEMAIRIPHTEIRESDLSVQFANGSMIRCLGADSADAIRGIGLDGAVADEFQLWDQSVIPLVILPTLAGRNGWLSLLGTPTGIDALTVEYDKRRKDPEWSCWLFTAEDTKAISEDELRIMRANMTPQQYDLELMCRFDAGAPNQLISGDLVEEAMARSYEPEVYNQHARVISVDIARQGSDRTVLIRRQGLQMWEPDIWQSSDLMYTTRRILEAAHAYKAHGVLIDGGGVGAGVVDSLRERGLEVIEVQFGAKASDDRYKNMRGEMYWSLYLWLKRGGRLPKNPDLKTELTSLTYHQDDHGRLALDSKDDLRKRGMRSPDLADSAALSFAFPVHATEMLKEADFKPRTDWDPFSP